MASAFEGYQAYNQSQYPFTPADLVRAVRTFIDFLIFSSLFVGIAGMGMIYISVPDPGARAHTCGTRDHAARPVLGLQHEPEDRRGRG